MNILPKPNFSERHQITVSAPPEKVYSIYRKLNLADAWAIRLLMLLRGIRLDPERPYQIFTLLQEDPPHSIVWGLIAKPWTLSGGLHRFESQDFSSFDEPDYAKITWDFTFHATPEGTRVVTETHIQCTDAASRKKFRRYWWFVRPFSGLLRRLILRRIAQEATHNP